MLQFNKTIQTQQQITSKINDWNNFVDYAVCEQHMDADNIAKHFKYRFDGEWENLNDAHTICMLFTRLHNILYPVFDTQHLSAVVYGDQYRYVATIALKIWEILKQHKCISKILYSPSSTTILIISLQHIACLIPKTVLTDLIGSDLYDKVWIEALQYHPKIIKMHSEIPPSKFKPLYNENKALIDRCARKYLTDDEKKQFKSKLKLLNRKKAQLEFKF